MVGATHGAGAGLGAAVAQEALHALPGVARAGASAADAALARIAMAVRTGQIPPQQMVQQAIAAGVKASTIEGLMRQVPAAAAEPAQAF
jgi:hypothetical protein